jgi:AbiU2
MGNPPHVSTLNDRVERATYLSVRSRVFFDIWFYFEGKDTRPAIINTMGRFSGFFEYDPEAHFAAFVIYIAALFDKRRNTISLPHLAREVKKKTTIEKADEIDALLQQAEPLANKVAILRNKVFGHRSANISYDDVSQQAAVTADELRALTELSLQIANGLARVCGCAEQSFEFLPLKHAAAMLQALAASPT